VIGKEVGIVIARSRFLALVWDPVVVEVLQRTVDDVAVVGNTVFIAVYPAVA
jgi:DNA-directed RNA polymerase subunit E'/Rpb7